jgi:hypothetical protein
MSAVNNQNRVQIDLGRELVYQATRSHSDGLLKLIDQKIDAIRGQWQADTADKDLGSIAIKKVKADYASLEMKQIESLASEISSLAYAGDAERTKEISAFLQNKLNVTPEHWDKHRILKQRIAECNDDVAAGFIERFEEYASPRLIKLFNKILRNEMYSFENKQKALEDKKAQQEKADRERTLAASEQPDAADTAAAPLEPEDPNPYDEDNIGMALPPTLKPPPKPPTTQTVLESQAPSASEEPSQTAAASSQLPADVAPPANSDAQSKVEGAVNTEAPVSTSEAEPEDTAVTQSAAPTPKVEEPKQETKAKVSYWTSFTNWLCSIPRSIIAAIKRLFS